MTTEYTARNRAIKQETGEIKRLGHGPNSQALDMFDESLDGVESVDLGAAATFDLSDAAHTKNGESDTSRQRILIFSNPRLRHRDHHPECRESGISSAILHLRPSRLRRAAARPHPFRPGPMQSSFPTAPTATHSAPA